MMKIKQLLLPLMAGMGSFMFNPSVKAQDLSMQKTKSTFSFVENKGQITDQFFEHRSDIDFKLQAGNGLNIFLGKGKIHYQWSEILPVHEQEIENRRDNKFNYHLDETEELSENIQIEMYRMDVELLNANPHPKVIKEGKNDFYERYYLSWVNKDNRNEGIQAHTYNKVTYKDVYPHIDWVFYVNAQQQVEHDFIVHPGGNVADIQLKYQGSIQLNIEEDGSLLAKTPKGTIQESAPYSFDEQGKEVSSAFKLNGDILSFEVGSYNGTLTIDPVVEWGTYFGGPDNDVAADLAMDKYGDIYMVGSTSSTSNIATTGAHETVYQGGSSSQEGDAFFSKWNSDGDLLWATYYGGEGVDKGISVACDTSGFVYFGGYTISLTGISTVGAYQEDLNLSYDAFLTKFDTAGVRVWATYFGGSGNEANVSFAMTADESDHIYISGNTQSLDLPTSSGVHLEDKVGSSSNHDIFLAKFDTAGDLIWSTYYGGTNHDHIGAIITDDNVYLTGYTRSADGIATNGTHQEVHADNDDAFLAKFDNTGSLVFGTYLGGENVDRGESVALYEDKIIIGGFTMSQLGISTLNAFKEIADPTPFTGEAFLAVFNELGIIEWATYYGGDNYDMITSIVMKDDNIYIYGETSSEQEISTTGGFQEDLAGYQNAFLAQFTIEGDRIWGTYFGGDVAETSKKIIINDEYHLYFNGRTASGSGIATPNAYQTSLGGGNYDAFLAKLNDCPIPEVDHLIGFEELCAQSIATFEVGNFEMSEEFIWILPDGWTGNSNTHTIDVTIGNEDGIVKVYALSVCGGISDTLSLEITVLPIPEPVVINNNHILTTTQSYTSYQWIKDGLDIPNATEAMFLAEENGVYQVRVTTENDCEGISEEEVIDGIGIQEIDLAQLMDIYPNPVKEQLFIKATQDMELNIYAMDGRIVQEDISIFKGDNVIDVKALNAGMYLISMQDANGNSGVMKFVVK